MAPQKKFPGHGPLALTTQVVLPLVGATGMPWICCSHHENMSSILPWDLLKTNLATSRTKKAFISSGLNCQQVTPTTWFPFPTPAESPRGSGLMKQRQIWSVDSFLHLIFASPLLSTTPLLFCAQENWRILGALDFMVFPNRCELLLLSIPNDPSGCYTGSCSLSWNFTSIQFT